MPQLEPRVWAAWISTQCTVLEAEAAAQGDTLGAQTVELQARFIRLKAYLYAAAPLPRLMRAQMLDQLARRHWPHHPDLARGDDG